MYRIFADSTLIYDSTIDDYKIGRGEVVQEVGKSGSFVFSIYPDHPFYNSFIRLKTVVTVYKSERIVFRGRVINDVTDYWNKKTLTCEGELGFLRDSVMRPFEFTGAPADLFEKFISEHNDQVDEFKRFKLGTVTVEDENDYINRKTIDYPTTQDVMASALLDSGLGGYLYITHGDDGTDPTPTIHYVADFPKTAMQAIEFGVNLQNYTKTVNAAEVVTAVIPLGVQTASTGQRMTIAEENGGADYVYDAKAVALFGWIFKTVVWDDVTLASTLKARAETYLAGLSSPPVTIELTAVDLHLLDRSIESYNAGEYVRATSVPHGFDELMLCNRQTLNLLQPASDTVTLGYQTRTFTGVSNQMAASVTEQKKTLTDIKRDAESVKIIVENLDEDITSKIDTALDGIELSVTNGSTSSTIALKSGGTVISSQDIIFDGFVTFAGLDDGTTTVDGGCIKTDSLYADALHLGGALTVYQSERSDAVGGYLGYDGGFNGSHGIGIRSSDDRSQVVCTGSAARLSHGGAGGLSQVVCSPDSVQLDGYQRIQFGTFNVTRVTIDSAGLYPVSASASCGTADCPWSDVYAAGTSFSALVARVAALETA